MPGFVRYPHPALMARAVHRPVDDQLRWVGETLVAAATDAEAYGLAAAHMGKVEPVVVVSIAARGEGRDYRVMFNPVVAETGGAVVMGVEGSVSLPGAEAEIGRHERVVMAFDDAHGVQQTLALEGFAARVAQHETEQCNGVFFLRHVSRLKRERLLKAAGKA